MSGSVYLVYAVLAILANPSTPLQIRDCFRDQTCDEPPGKVKVKWTSRHEELFWFGIGTVIRGECKALKATGKASYISPDAVDTVEESCPAGFVRSLNSSEAARLLVSGKVKTVVEFKRLDGFNINGGRMVGGIVYYSYTTDLNSHRPRRDGFEQYEFIETEKGIELRQIASAVP